MKILKMCLTSVAVALFALPAMGEKKLLPIKITSDRFSLIYTYDDLNRIRSIVENMAGLIEVKTFDYYANGMGYAVHLKQYDSEDEMLRNDPYQTSIDSTSFINKTDSTINFERDSENLIYTFSPSGKMTEVQVRSRHSELKRFFEPTIKISFLYDENENLMGVDLPEKAIAQKLNQRIQRIDDLTFMYDDKNGVFKHINPACFSEIYSETIPLEYFYFMSNNLLEMTYKQDRNPAMEKRKPADFLYKYNADDYPIEMTNNDRTIFITYIEVE